MAGHMAVSRLRSQKCIKLHALSLLIEELEANYHENTRSFTGFVFRESNPGLRELGQTVHITK
jgi:hypothetical protein